MIYDGDESDQPDLDDDVYQLTKAWQTEVHSPEVLPFKRDVVESISQRISDQQAIIEERVSTPEEIFTAGLYQMDIDRVRYSLARYLRARILKIEQSVDYIMAKTDVLDRLSSQEKTFVSKLYNLNNSYMEEAYFNRLTQEGLKENIEQESDRLLHAQPSLKEFVFCFANTDLPGMALGGNVPTDVNKNDVFVACYGEVREHVLNNNVDLI